MATKEEVKNYLRNLKDKVGIFNIVFRNDRQKNSQTLLELEIQPDQRTRIITELQAIDYCEGPLEDTLNGLPDF